MTALALFDPDTWQAANWHHLLMAIASLRQVLEQLVDQEQPAVSASAPSIVPNAVQPADPLHTATPFALEHLCKTFGLTDFERDVLLLCVGVELDPIFSLLCAQIQSDRQRSATFSLALNALAQPHWSALTPQRPLRQWRLIDIGEGPALTLSPLRIDERILHYLTGVPHCEGRVLGMIKPVLPTGELVPSHQQVAQQVAAVWLQGMSSTQLPIVQLCGDDPAGKRAIASTACHLLSTKLSALSTPAIPTNPTDLTTLMLLWEREVILSQSALLLDCDSLDSSDAAREGAISQWIEQSTSLLIVSSRDRRRAGQRPLITFDVALPTKSEQRLLWNETLGDATASLNGQVEALVAQFNLNAPTIQAVCVEAIGYGDGLADQSTDLASSQQPATLWDICRAQARPRMDDMAQRIIPAASWDDLVLPEREYQVLRSIAAHVRQRIKVYDEWGFAAKGQRGLGISALFAGTSGTGKTMSAEVLAQELRLDLYRIDLSSVVSKYIGETEKNLRGVFDAAEAGATILLFDEADALFGKRSEVKDSHDRYANMEVSYLLQRMEAYQGLAILTTNMKESIDTAFLRRIRFIVKFPFPDFQQRVEIWRRIFPKATPTKDLDETKLAKLNVAGGNIRNIAIHAAFLAADGGEPVQMKHLLEAAWSEYIKMERTLTDAEVKGWVQC